MTSKNVNSLQSISDRTKPTKEQLEHDFFTLLLNKREVAVKYGYSPYTIGTWLREWDIKRLDVIKYNSSSQVRKLRLAGTVLTDRQKSIIVGSILGDGSISKMDHVATKSARLYIGQKDSRKEYLVWLGEELQPFLRKISRRKQGNYLLATICHPVFNKFYDLFWVGGKEGRKCIPPNIEELLDEIALSIFYMDDGRLDTSSSTLSTCAFTIPENELLLSALKNKFDIEGKIKFMSVKYKDEKRIYPYLEFRREG